MNDNFDFEDEDFEEDDNLFNERKFIILELLSGSNNIGQECWIAKVNPLDIMKMGSFSTASFTPSICKETRTLIFPAKMEKYLLFLMYKQKPITIDEDLAEIGYIDGQAVSVFNSLGNDENFEEYYNLPFECQECRLISPNCHNCEYNSCCLECEYINHCNR